MNTIASFADSTDAAHWVQRIVDGAIRVLAERGLHVAREDVLADLRQSPNCTVQGSRVMFAIETARGFVEDYHQRHPFTPPTTYSVGAIGHSNHMVDLDGTLRPVLLADIEQGARLIGAMQGTGINGIAPGIPQDVPPPLQGLAQLIAGAKNKPGSAGYAPHYPQAQPFLRECFDILGQGHGAGIHVVSPLRFEGQEVDEALGFRAQNPGGSLGIGTMPIIGASTPASVLSSFALALAEIVGCALILIATGTPATQIGMAINAYPFDMRHGCFVYGTPSNIVCTMVERELNRYLGGEIPAKSFSVMAQHPGPQACALKGMFTGFMFAQGRMAFSGAGGLSLDEIWSPVQLIYDREILGFLVRSREMLEASLDEELLLVDEIINAGSDNFMEADSTLQHFRTLQWDSNVFPTRMLRQWQQAGEPREHEAAQAEIGRLLAECEYELAADKAVALDVVYARAASALL